MENTLISNDEKQKQQIFGYIKICHLGINKFWIWRWGNIYYLPNHWGSRGGIKNKFDIFAKLINSLFLKKEFYVRNNYKVPFNAPSNSI